ncbi:unnamed protein product [Linum trigynum]|uniref:CCHC-type domain-containing protein n=1 Tax=Linum trigynum TaxID=586398 RepID=A0AAV2C688_9ROSI
MLVVRSWVPPSPAVAASLLWEPLEVQMWGVPFECFTAKLAQRLGSALGETTTPTLHRSDVSGGLYFRAEPVLDLAAPLPVEIEVGHVTAGKGNFIVKIKYERLPVFCYFCGIIGHIGANCPRKADLEEDPPRYGRFMVSEESGPEITEDMLSRRKKRLTWLRAMSQKPPSFRPAGGFKTPRPQATSGVLVAQMGARLGSNWEDTRRPRPVQVGERMQLLSLNGEPSFAAATHLETTKVEEGMIDEDVAISSPPAAKRIKHNVPALDTNSRVEATSPDWSHGNP